MSKFWDAKFMMYTKFSIRVKAKVELKSSILIGAITEISPKGFTLGVKVEKENNFFNLLLYDPDLTLRQKKKKKKKPNNLGGQFATLWGQCEQAPKLVPSLFFNIF